MSSIVKPVKPKELKCGTAAYQKWWRDQKKLNDPEYLPRKREGDRRRKKKWYANHKEDPEIREKQLKWMKENYIKNKESYVKYYQDVVKPKKEALKAT